MSRSIPRKKDTFVALALCAVAYLYVFPLHPGLNNPNENARFYMTMAIVEEGTYVIDSQRAQYGWVNDCAIYEGRAYSVKAPGTSFLGVLPYGAYHFVRQTLDLPFDWATALWLSRVFASILPLFAFLFFFHRFLGRYAPTPLIRDAAFFSFALGSCAYGYGMLFMSHSLSAAAAFASFAFLLDKSHRTKSNIAFFAGFVAAGVSLLEYPGFIASATLCLYAMVVLKGWRTRLFFIIGALIPTLAMMHFQWAAFGNPLTPGHLYVESDFFRGRHEEGFFGAVGVSWEALYGLFFHPGAGLFPLTPLAVFSFAGFFSQLRTRRDALSASVALTIVVLSSLAIASMNNWRGGWTIGPRYLVLVYPFLIHHAVIGLSSVHRRSARTAAIVAVAFTAAAIVLSGLPSAYYPHFPPEIERPFGEVVVLLIRDGYAPLNALNALGVWGTLSMLPLLLVLALAAFYPIVHAARARRPQLLGASALLAIALIAALSFRFGTPPPVRRAQAFITEHWHPSGHDRASELEQELGRVDSLDERRRLHEDLAAIYRRQGRDRLAEQHSRRAAHER